MMKSIAALVLATGTTLLTADVAWAQTATSSSSAAITSPPPPPPPPPPPLAAPAPRDTDARQRDEISTDRRILATTDKSVPRSFVMYENDEVGAFFKPVLQMSAALVGYAPKLSSEDDKLSGRTSTLLLARFGVEGRITDWISFRSVFERNVGYSLARNGPVGTSVWEGTASLQARENYIRLDRWGFALSGGIVPDPASIDFISENTLDLFGMDPYVRDPLLVSGFNQGQGFLLRYSKWGATLGFAFTGGNPLTTSLSFGFGGQVSSLATLVSAPLRAIASGLPGSNIHVLLFSPSLTYEHDFFDVKLAAQFYSVDVDLTNDVDQGLTGYNLRATAQVKPFGDMLRVFASGAMRKNQQIAVTDVTMRLENDFAGAVFGAGADFVYGDFSVGGQYYWVRTEESPDNALFNQYINVGATYWLYERTVSAGVRWAHSRVDAENEAIPNLLDTHSFIGSLRLLL